jgi:hypothetical protein
MDLIPPNLRAAALDARDRLARFSQSAAEAGTNADSGARLQATMASTARDAIFADALLGAMRAHLEELRTVTK